MAAVAPPPAPAPAAPAPAASAPAAAPAPPAVPVADRILFVLVPSFFFLLACKVLPSFRRRVWVMRALLCRLRRRRPGRPTPCPVLLSVLAGSFPCPVQIDAFLLSLSLLPTGWKLQDQ